MYAGAPVFDAEWRLMGEASYGALSARGRKVTKIRTRLCDLMLRARPLAATRSGGTDGGVNTFHAHKRKVRLSGRRTVYPGGQ